MISTLPFYPTTPYYFFLSSSDCDDDHLSYDMLDDVLTDKNIVRTKTFLYVSDLSRKNARAISRKYYLYFLNLGEYDYELCLPLSFWLPFTRIKCNWRVCFGSLAYLNNCWFSVTISVFYALPVMQLVLTYQTTIQVTGNEDICYYNWRCAYRLGSGLNCRHYFSLNRTLSFTRNFQPNWNDHRFINSCFELYHCSERFQQRGVKYGLRLFGLFVFGAGRQTRITLSSSD